MTKPFEQHLADTFGSLSVDSESAEQYVATVMNSIHRRNRQHRLLFVGTGMAAMLFLGYGLWIVRPVSPALTTAASEQINAALQSDTGVEPIVLDGAQLGHPNWGTIVGSFVADVGPSVLGVIALCVAAYLGLYFVRRFQGIPIDRRWSVVALAATGILVAITLRLTVTAFWLASGGMEPTLPVDSRVLVAKNDTDVRIGDIVLVRGDAFDAAAEPSFGYLIKRVVGLEGDVVQGVDGALLVNERPIINPALGDDASQELDDFGPVTVGPGEVFLIGDNYGRSFDSRFGGPARVEDLAGTVRWRFFG